jgi:hypothetical protein
VSVEQVTVTITADTSRFDKAMLQAWWAVVRRQRQASDANPFPRFHLFGLSHPLRRVEP